MVQKWPVLQLFFLGNIGEEKFFYDILEPKTAFLGNKNKKFKKVEKLVFFQRGQPLDLVQKWPVFQLLFLGNIGQENVCYDILERINAFLGYKNNKLKQAKNWHFSKGVNAWFWSKNGHYSKFFFWQYRPGNSLLRYSRTKKRLSRL